MKNNFKIKTITFLVVLLLFSCQSREHKYTFYYWRTTLKLDKTEKEALSSTTDKLYVRYFDIDKKQDEIKIIGSAVKTKSFQTTKTIVPVVFIMNRTFSSINKEEIKQLASKIVNEIATKTTEFEFKNTNEIQIDCDWTQRTKNAYFTFLKELKNISNKNISVTLRLHQVKFRRKTGVPPVDKVSLMCYATSSPLEKSEKNSILEVDILKNYLATIDTYPIKNIAVALPIYSWGIVTNHLEKHKLINKLNSKSLNNVNFERISDDEVKILKDGFYFGFFLNKGFTIKIEEISQRQLTEVVTFLDGKIKNYDIIYYHLDAQFIKNKKLNL